MVVNARKSRKNADAFIPLPSDARLAIDLLIDTRAQVGVPPTNMYIFAHINANTPMSGHSKLQELANSCEALKFPKQTAVQTSPSIK